MTVDGRQVETGLGGMHVYVNGAIGGLMTTNPQTTVRRSLHAAAVHGAVARQGARARPPAGAGGAGRGAGRRHCRGRPSRGSAFAARTLELPIDNTLFRLANALGLFGRGQPRLNHIRSEVAVLTFGDASVTCVPGELYPEIANGGIERPPGADFDLRPGRGSVAARADARAG